MISVRLTKKLAASLNGIDVSALRVGDVIELPDSAARMMIAEGWAEPEAAPARTSRVPPLTETVTPFH